MSDYPDTDPYPSDRDYGRRPRYERGGRSYEDRTGGYSRDGFRPSFERRGGGRAGYRERSHTYTSRGGRDSYTPARHSEQRGRFPTKRSPFLDAVRGASIRKRASSSRSLAKRFAPENQTNRQISLSTNKTADQVARISEDNGPILFCWPNERLYGFMALDFRCQFECEGWTYGSVESWMMANQADISGHQLLWQKLLQESSIAKQRDLFESIKLKPDHLNWVEVKSAILEEGVSLKFVRSINSGDLHRLLMATGDRELIYANSNSRDYGIGFEAKDAEMNRQNWGRNLLGEVLMKVRTQLQEQAPKVTSLEENSFTEVNNEAEYSPSSVQIEENEDRLDDYFQATTDQAEKDGGKDDTIDAGDVAVDLTSVVDLQEESQQEEQEKGIGISSIRDLDPAQELEEDEGYDFEV